MNKKIEEIALQTHIKWLPKAKTAKIDGSEMTVLPYGYLSQAVIEVIEQERERIIEEINKLKVISPNVEPPKNRLSQNQIFIAGQMNVFMRLEDIIKNIK